MTSFNGQDEYRYWVTQAERYAELKRREEARIDIEAQQTFRTHQTLAGTSVRFIANGMKANSAKLREYQTEIDRALAWAQMYGLGMLNESIERLASR